MKKKINAVIVVFALMAMMSKGAAQTVNWPEVLQAQSSEDAQKLIAILETEQSEISKKHQDLVDELPEVRKKRDHKKAADIQQLLIMLAAEKTNNKQKIAALKFRFKK